MNQIAEEIQNYISLKAKIKPGERLPTERELAEMLGVSRVLRPGGLGFLETLQFLGEAEAGITVKLELKPFVSSFPSGSSLIKTGFQSWLSKAGFWRGGVGEAGSSAGY